MLLAWGADGFVVGAAVTARNLGTSPLVVGLTVVAFGTSAPEMVVSAMASWQETAELSVGNAIGSNLANTGLVLGLTALVAPVTVQSTILRRELPLLFAAMWVAWGLLADGHLGRIDGVVLLLGLAAYLGFLARESIHARRRATPDPLATGLESGMPPAMSTRAAVGRLVLGLTILLVGSRALVWGAVEVARLQGVSELVIGLSVIAVGTSLPELAASLASAFRNEPDIAVGNVIGSNLFNLLAVLPVPGLVAPGPTPATVVSRDLPAMLAVTTLLWAFAWGFGGRGRILRTEGALLLAGYAAYVVAIFLMRS